MAALEPTTLRTWARPVAKVVAVDLNSFGVWRVVPLT